MMSKYVAIIDDDEAIRASLCSLLSAEGLQAVSHDSAEAFLEHGLNEQIGCLVVDIQMPGMSGLDLQIILQHRGIGLPIIVITGQGDVPKAVQALKAGALDFFEKPYDINALVGAINLALDRESRRQHRDQASQDFRGRLASLSRREREVMDLMVQGHPNKRIAQILGISPRTVENHRASVMEKTDSDHLSALIHRLMRLDSSAP
jgi:FixJ family two-component response regulator